MNVEAFVASGFAVLAYGASAGISIELPNGRRVSPTAAFGPAVAALGGGGYEVAPSVALFASAVLIELVVVVLRKSQVRTAVLHSVALAASFLVVMLSGRLGDAVGVSATLALVGGVGLGSIVYFGLDVVGLATSKRTQPQASLTESSRATLPLAVVMLSTAGLIVLVFPHLRWASFGVLYLPVLAARYEFARYGEARRTYRQTVNALAGLTEGAGYVPSGHHARVAKLCVKIGQELGLPHETTRELELVGLLHDVGAVSLPEVSDVTRVDPKLVALSSGRILEETGHLAKYAPMLRDAIEGGETASLEARILRVADAYDGLTGPPMDRLQTLKASLRSSDDEVWAALYRVAMGKAQESPS